LTSPAPAANPTPSTRACPSFFYIHRSTVTAYKGPARRPGKRLENRNGEFVAIFDADFLPNPIFFQPHHFRNFFMNPGCGGKQDRHVQTPGRISTQLPRCLTNWKRSLLRRHFSSVRAMARVFSPPGPTFLQFQRHRGRVAPAKPSPMPAPGSTTDRPRNSREDTEFFLYRSAAQRPRKVSLPSRKSNAPLSRAFPWT